MTREIKKQITILGAGKIGLALATLWFRAGYDIYLGSRNPEEKQAEVNALDLKVSVKNIIDAAAIFIRNLIS